MDKVRCPYFAPGEHRLSLAHEGKVAIVEADARDDLRPARLTNE
jgi:hypothetical protein